MFEKSGKTKNGVIVHSELLLEYLKKKYPGLYFVSSTTKVLTDFDRFTEEVDREEFRYAVPDFRLNKALDQWDTLSERQKAKVEFLCNECCFYGCRDRKRCYEAVSRKNLGEDGSGPLLYGSRRRGGLPIFQSHEKSRIHRSRRDPERLSSHGLF